MCFQRFISREEGSLNEIWQKIEDEANITTNGNGNGKASSGTNVNNLKKMYESFTTMANALYYSLRQIPRNGQNNGKTLTYEEKVDFIAKDTNAFKKLKEDLRAQELVTNYAIKQYMEMKFIINSRVNAMMLDEVASSHPRRKGNTRRASISRIA